MKTAVFLAMISLCLSGPGALAQDYHGHVTRQNARLTRPAEEEQPAAAPLSLSAQKANIAPHGQAGGVSVDGFQLSADKFKASAASLDGWNPYAGLTQQSRMAPRTILPAAAAESSAPVAVDYDAIERAYAESVPRFALRPAVLNSGPMPSLYASNPTLAQAAAAGRLNAAGGITGSQTVDVDNCLCATPIPTQACVRSRMHGFGTNVNVNPTVSMPGAAPSVMRPTMIPSGNAFGRTR